MSAGTIKLTNGSTAVVGTGTAFTSDLKSGDVITATVGGIFFTLFVDAVTSNTALTLTDPFTGPTTSGLAWVAVPQLTLNRITAALAAQTAESVRRVLQENANWQAFYTGTGDITVTLPDGTPAGRPVTGPSWTKIAGLTNSALQWRGNIPANSNLNNFGPTSAYTGAWGQSNASSTTADVANGYPVSENGILEVFPGGRFNGAQRYTSTTSGRFFIRWLTATWNAANPSWSAWVEPGLPLRGDLNTTDLNTITGENQGIHFQSRNRNATTALNYPINVAGSLRVYQTAADNIKSCIQYYDAWDRDIAYRRTGVSDSAGVVTWSAWSLVGTSGANKALNDLGIGAPITVLSALDWQTFNFIPGAEHVCLPSNQANIPSGLSFVSTSTRTNINVIGGYSGSTSLIMLVTQFTTAANAKNYIVIMAGNPGSRTFTIYENFSTASTIPITNGGTGAPTAAAARTALGVPAGVDSQLCSAWVLFNGSTGAIRSGFNVSSITKNREGDYYINFAQAMSSNLYCAQIGVQAPREDATTRSGVLYATGDTGSTGLETNRCRILVGDTTQASLKDQSVIGVVIFGGR